MEKYGFVYIWFDKKHKRFYIGSHWGTEDDGYVCSSRWMRKSYKRRSDDFKRRIVSKIDSSRTKLLEKEYQWLQLIDDSQLGKRYYNLTKHQNGHWSTNSEKVLSVGQKISVAKKGCKSWNKGKSMPEETKQKLRLANKKQFEDPEQRLIRVKKSKEWWSDPTYRESQSKAKIGKPQSKETIEKRAETIKTLGIKVGSKKGNIPWNKGIKDVSASKRLWWNNGITNRRASDCPGPDFVLGRKQKELL
jgi:hypothetical protein